MTRRGISLFQCGLLAAGYLMVCGCGDSPPTADRPAKPVPAAGADSPADKTPESPNAAQAVLAVVEGFRQNRPEAIWEFLPASHQREINDLARDFATRMDDQLWRQTTAVARESAGLLKTHQRQILSHPALRDSPWIADGTLSARWDGLVALLATLSTGELADLERMKSFDGRQFFAHFDAASLAQLEDLSILLADDNPFRLLPEILDGAQIRLIREQTDSAVVEIRPKNGEPRLFEFVRVEGKWLPRSWVAGFAEDMRLARARLDVELAPDVLAQKKKQVMPYLEEAGEILDELRNAGSDAAFHAVMTERIIKPAMMLGGETPEPAAPVNIAGDGENAVIVVVAGELTPAGIDRVANALLAGGDVDRELTINRANGRTRFVVSPVRDVAAFAASIEFGTVTATNAAGRTISVELPPPRQPE